MGVTENSLGRAGFIFLFLYVLDNVYQVIVTKRPSVFGLCFWKKVDCALLLLNGHNINLLLFYFSDKVSL